MNKVLICLLSIVGLSAGAQSGMNKQAVKAIMDRVNRYRFEHPWQEFDDNWIRGTYYAGVMACYQATGDRAYLDQSEAFCQSLGWKLPTVPPWKGGSGANLLTCGQTMVECYLVKKEKYKIEGIIDHLEDPGIKNPVSSPLEWYFEAGRRYVDGLFTGPPTLAMLHAVTGDAKYLCWMETMFWDVYGKLYDREENLFYRDRRFFPDRTEQRENDPGREDRSAVRGPKVLWSRGNGWAFAGITRILKYLPEDYPGHQRYLLVFRNIAASLAGRQSEAGYWYPNLADPDHVPLKETSGTGFFIYGLAYGINQGILEREKYLPVVEKAWKSLCDAVSEEGKVQWGQKVGDRPVMHSRDDSHEFVSGIFLLAASEVYKLASERNNPQSRVPVPDVKKSLPGLALSPAYALPL
jgi:unsaturated rhamnogalacturonyl hydrolase